MAERRMFAKTIIDSDSFLDMPMSTQALYFHLSMRADDDGFINNPKKIQRMVGATEDDLKLLIAKNFILVFESGVIVIKHWKIHNYIRNDRYKPTVYQEEMSQLNLKENGAYTLGIPNGYQMDTQVRIGKDRLGKDSIGDVLEMYEQNFGTLSPTTTEMLMDLEQEYSEKFLKEAMKRAIEKNKKNLAYIKGILKQWKDKTWEEIISEGKEVKPKWIGKDIKKQDLTESEKEELDDLLKEFE